MAKIPRLDLPAREGFEGGWVEFGNPANLSGKAYREIQAAIRRHEDGSAIAAEALPLIEAALITAWRIPYIREGGRIVPNADPTLLDQVQYPELIAIDQAVLPALSRISFGRPLQEDEPDAPLAGDPSTASD